MSHQPNSSEPLRQPPTVVFKRPTSSYIEVLQESEEEDQTTRFQTRQKFGIVRSIQSSGPLGLFLFLTTNIVATWLWYHINLDSPLMDETSSARLLRWSVDGFFIAPWGLLSILCSVIALGTIFQPNNNRDHATGIARAGMGAFSGAIVVLVLGFHIGVFKEEAFVNILFWGTTGMVPGAGIWTVLGFILDLCWRREEKVEDGDEDEKTPLLVVEEV